MEFVHIPLILTLLRLIISPLFLPILLVYLLPYNLLWLNSILGLFFVLLSLTDFFDGYLARKYNQETVLGRVLDPIADKFLTVSALVALLAAGKIYFYWVIILIGRELFVMGLRHVALEHNFTIPVAKLGKLKTVTQMACITMFIVNPYQQLGGHALRWNGAEMALLFIAIVLSLFSAQQYYDEFMKLFRKDISSPIVTQADYD